MRILIRVLGILALSTADRYIGWIILRAYCLVACALTALFSLLEFVEQLASVGEGHYQVADAALYTLCTMPYRLLQVTPSAMLIGCLLGLGGLGRQSELTALRAAGMSEYRIGGTAIRLMIPIGLLLFLLAEYGIPISQQFAQQERSVALYTSLRSEDDFWAYGDRQYLHVQHFERRDIPTNIDVYEFNTDGTLAEYLHADRADIRPDGRWLLANATRKRLSGGSFQTEREAALMWQPFLSASQTQLLRLPPDSMPPIALYKYIRSLRQRHLQALLYEQEFWMKVDLPFATLAMILISFIFVFRPSRTQNTGSQIAIGACFGVVCSLAQQIAGNLDLVLDLNPAVAALAPSFLLMALAIGFFRRS
ncbi:LPS export ABC transporter permease LptG [Acidisoma cellulosilyticum]|uniref:LPS export ABC transporter permease LptG n=1 Tax=Acidisoma cellulosilyticum TaxID=2802395 RepID=UPI001D0BD2C3|nr:LPS export ABC transporter permease LptG [Acidisoma cellulosilyticum]